MSGGTTDLVFVWRQNERVSSGRRAESLAMWFSRHPEVHRVIYLEPPLSRKSIKPSASLSAPSSHGAVLCSLVSVGPEQPGSAPPSV